MRRLALVLMCGLVWIAAGALRAAEGTSTSAQMPLWAYGYPSLPSGAAAPPHPPAAPATPVADFPRQAPGSKYTWTRAQLMNPYGPAEFFPDEHPPMPDIVAKGKQAAKVTACSLCHRAHGMGQPENAPVNGLPVSYFVQQMNDFKNGLRKSTDPKKGNAAAMIAFAKGMTEEDIKAAAEYFASIPYKPWITVKETNTVSKQKYVNNLAEMEEGTEPIGKRVIETPENLEMKDKYRSPHHGFIAYVPNGSIKKGEQLARTGGNRTVSCASCHGVDLKGMGPVPALAGRSASYIGRQLHDFQTGARNGEWAQLMKPVVAKLTDEDLVNLSAYAASIKP